MRSRILTIWLCLCLLVCAAACTRRSGSGEPDTAVPAWEDTPGSVSAQEDTTEPIPDREGSAGPVPAQEADLPELYVELTNSKTDLVALVQERVDIYKNAGETQLGSGHMAYPADYPDVSALPGAITASDFVIRCSENLDALEAIYAAVPIADGYELRMAFSKQDADGALSWSCGWTWFAHVDDVPWIAQDFDIYG